MLSLNKINNLIYRILNIINLIFLEISKCFSQYSTFFLPFFPPFQKTSNNVEQTLMTAVSVLSTEYLGPTHGIGFESLDSKCLFFLALVSLVLFFICNQSPFTSL